MVTNAHFPKKQLRFCRGCSNYVASCKTSLFSFSKVSLCQAYEHASLDIRVDVLQQSPVLSTESGKITKACDPDERTCDKAAPNFNDVICTAF